MGYQNKLFIGGEFVDGVDGATIEVLNPHDCSVLTEIAEARAADVDRAVAAAADGLPGWRRTAAAERGRLLLRLADAIDAHAGELATLESTDTGHPIKDSTRPRRAADGGLLPLLRRHGRQAPGRRHPGRDRLPELRQPRAARRGRADRAVELPADVLQLEDGAGPGRREHGRAQAERADPAVVAAPGRADGRGRLPARRRQHRARLRPHGRGAARQPPRRAQGRVHRLDGGGPADRGELGRQPEAGPARARRQGRQHRVRRTPTCPRRSTARPSPSSTTRARPASPAAGSSSTRRSRTSSSTAS